MCRNYKCAPLPFMGQKRYFIRDFSEVLKQVAGQIDTVVDLFGGSGLLSYTAKKVLPGCRVIYNDFDHYDRRLAAVEDTNAILTTIKQRLSGVQANQRLTQEQRADVLRIVEEAQNRLGWVDIMTIGRSVLFSGKWVTSLEELRKHTMYNRVRPVPAIWTGWRSYTWTTGNCSSASAATGGRCLCWTRRILRRSAECMRIIGS